MRSCVELILSLNPASSGAVPHTRPPRPLRPATVTHLSEWASPALMFTQRGAGARGGIEVLRTHKKPSFSGLGSRRETDTEATV